MAAGVRTTAQLLITGRVGVFVIPSVPHRVRTRSVTKELRLRRCVIGSRSHSGWTEMLGFATQCIHLGSAFLAACSVLSSRGLLKALVALCGDVGIRIFG